MASVVGKTIFSDGKGKLFFGYYKTDDAVEFVDYKTWKKLSFKDVSKGDTNKERVIKAILKNQKQFNKKVDFNMWAKKNKPSFEQTMDWFIQNGWISNINKGGIKEGAGDVNKAPIPSSIKIKLEKALDVLDGKKLTYPQKLQVLGRVLDSMGIDKGELNKVTQKLRTKLESVNEGKVHFEKKLKSGNIFQVIDRDTKGMRGTQDKFSMQIVDKRGKVIKHIGSHPSLNGAKKYSDSIKEGKKRFKRQDGIGKSKYTISYHDGKKKHKDGSDFFDIKIFKNKKDLSDFVGSLVKQGYKLTNESVNEAKFGYKTSTASYINKHKDEYKQAEKMNKGNEIKFYDMLQQMEDKLGHPKTMLFISNALRGYGVDMYKDPKIKNPADAQEALFLLSK